jgi:hypothetical protein
MQLHLVPALLMFAFAATGCGNGCNLAFARAHSRAIFLHLQIHGSATCSRFIHFTGIVPHHDQGINPHAKVSL